ncbi:large subunit ribosomal protein L28 [Actinoplanes octamycinicus]|uniref:Large ribosomal subunit protein bL28 n=1 Tax=Actinoplanes octamycinicus TaxID=135948 RepID=A0A7W7H195_9ACTN|nr:50S ribosomal protein L28 [Actinoplanes octamycinicus]MBB4742047.1 large subunit ribosomal protein L28 [Actinoplanes octamycinicus]GIE63717.1 50S ribosomal protein L28 [Actinoplanes octamycinicus]
MPFICDVTGAQPTFGNAVSFSHRRTRRRWNPNVQRRRFRLTDGSTVRLTVSTTGLKIIDRDGIDAVMARVRARKATR